MTENPCNLGVSASELLCTGRVKSYPDGSMELMACSAPVFKPSGWESSGWHTPAPDASPNGYKKPKSSNACSNERAMRRARAQVRDLALCTPFRWFVTLTLDRARVDRYDMKEITRHLNHWLDNQVRRRGLSTFTASSTTRWRRRTAARCPCRAPKPPGSPGAPASGPNGWPRGPTPSSTFRAGLGASRRQLSCTGSTPAP